jgi:glycosyltransferase involved in cell wall biosynthesis
MQPAPSTRRRVGLVTAGFNIGGGVATIARWLRDCLRSTGGYEVDVHDMATSSRDTGSRRLLAPQSWVRRSLRGVSAIDGAIHWGANAVEIETMRYRPRRELTDALRSYDLIQVVSGGPALAAAVIRAGVPTVLQVATTIAWERQRQIEEQIGPSRIWRLAMTSLTTSIEREALREVDAVLVENSAMLSYVRSIGQRHVVKALPGVDTRMFYPHPAGWQRNGYLLSLCRLDDARKGINRLIRAYAYMVKSDETIPKLILAGRGRLPDAAHGLIALLGISSRVAVRPDIGDSELPELYRGASVYLQTSYEEGLGMSVLEAMACGVPVVSTETAGTKETVIDGVTGCLVPQDPQNDVSAMVANRTLNVLHHDGATLGAGGRSRSVEAFSSEVALRGFTDTYDVVLARGNA